MTRSMIRAGALAGLLSATTSATLAASLTTPTAADPAMQANPAMVLPPVCQDLALVAAYVAVAGPTGVMTIPMAQTGPAAFVMARHPDWPATGHIRLIWAPTANAPANLLAAVDIAADPVLMDGMPVAEAFVGGDQVATAIRDVSLDLAAWPHVVTLQVGAVPAGSACVAHGAAPATLTLIAPITGLPPLDPGIGNGLPSVGSVAR